MIISGQRLIDLVNDGACEFADRCEAKGPGQFRPCVGKSLFGSLTFGDIGDDAFQFDIAAWANIELSSGGHVQSRAVSMDNPVLMAERRLASDRLGKRLLLIDDHARHWID
jgi:hypothetical protein